MEKSTYFPSPITVRELIGVLLSCPLDARVAVSGIEDTNSLYSLVLRENQTCADIWDIGDQDWVGDVVVIV